MPIRDRYPAGVPCWVDTNQPEPAAACEFYGALFGWTFENAMPEGSEGEYFIGRLRGGDVAAISSVPSGGAPAATWNTYVWVTDAAATYPRVLDELVPAAWHHVERYENNRIEADHGRLKHRLRPMRGLRTDRTAKVVIAGLAFVQNLRRGHYELGIDAQPALRVAAAFIELAQAI